MSASQTTISCLVSAVTAAAVLAAPKLAFACAVCFSGRDDATQLAFRVSTAVMTFLPFLLVGGLLWWLRKRFRQLAEEEERRSADSLSVDPPVGAQSTLR